MKSYIKIIIVILGVSLITIYCYSQGATANWKTYTNSKYGFTFQYPGTWVMEEDTDIIVSGKVTSRSISFTDTISKTFLLIGYSLYQGADIYNFYSTNYDSSHSKRITVDGNDAIQITTAVNRNGKGKLLNRIDRGKEIDVEFLDKKKTGEFELKFIAHLNNLTTEIKKFDHLINSFRFLK
jgi:hypothetical protein